MPHTIIERPPTKEELAIVEFENRPDLASNIFLLIFAVAGFLVAGGVAGWLAELLRLPHPERLRYLAWAVVVILYVISGIGFNLADKPRRRRAKMDAHQGMVQQIEIRNPKAVLLGYETTADPLLVLDIGDGKLLYLHGQWMYDNRVFGAPEFDPEVLDEIVNQDRVNGMPDPYGFPSTEFTMVRMRHLGRILSVRVSGEYLPPEERTGPLLAPHYNLNQSELLDGAIDDAPSILHSENERRKENAT
ncbi:MAG: hypothetical protein OEZ55_01515 [Nitrospinota bacterium]|nr:hypothetical protein [Nitrospinota bacterium]